MDEENDYDDPMVSATRVTHLWLICTLDMVVIQEICKFSNILLCRSFVVKVYTILLHIAMSCVAWLCLVGIHSLCLFCRIVLHVLLSVTRT